MSKLVWDAAGEHIYETGTSQGVLYPQKDNGSYNKGVVWNGLVSVTESPSGGDSNDQYADDIKYLSLMSTEDFGATVEAFTYPEEFAICDGSVAVKQGVYIGQQTRQAFGLSYKTKIGNDIKGVDYGYKLHLIYGAKASPSERGYQTINDSPEAITFSWELTTTPTNVEGYKPTAQITIDSTKVDETALKALEDKLYGTDTEDATLPLPAEVFALFPDEAPTNTTGGGSGENNEENAQG